MMSLHAELQHETFTIEERLYGVLGKGWIISEAPVSGSNASLSVSIEGGIFFLPLCSLPGTIRKVFVKESQSGGCI